MSIKTSALSACMVWALCSFIHVGAASGDAGEALTRRDVLSLLPKGIDMEDKAEIEKYQRLLDLGEKAYPALAQLLDETNDPLLAGRILAVFVDSSGDKEVPVVAIKKFLAKIPGDDDEAVIVRLLAVRALGRVGSVDDRDAVYELLEDSNEKVRINALRALSTLGTAEDGPRIEQYMERLKSRMSAVEISQDYSLIEADKVIGKLESKHFHSASVTNKTIPRSGREKPDGVPDEGAR